MDMGIIRGLITVVLLVAFVGLWIKSWSKKQQSEFSAAANLPLEDDSRPPADTEKTEQDA